MATQFSQRTNPEKNQCAFSIPECVEPHLLALMGSGHMAGYSIGAPSRLTGSSPWMLETQNES